MIPLVRGGGRLPQNALPLALGSWVFFASSTMAYGGGLESLSHIGHSRMDRGGHGLYPGFYGFGLSYHLGYGYGGYGLGVGADGGYPYYGGPAIPTPGLVFDGVEESHLLPITAAPAIPPTVIPITTEASARWSSIGRLFLSSMVTSRALPATTVPLPGLFPIPRRSLPLTRPRPPQRDHRPGRVPPISPRPRCPLEAALLGST